jgi:prepilin-type N-terminal cleavage/methylation domain-containing protein
MTTLHQKRIRAQHGFSLIELAIVLVIVGLVAGGALTAWTSQLVQQRINATKVNQETIKTALIQFISRNNRLPCPAIAGLLPSAAAYGQEAPTPGTCTGAVSIGVPPADASRGIVPWVSLGLPSEVGSDAYNTRYTYTISKSATNLTSATLPGMRGTLSLHNDAPIVLGRAPIGNQLNACSATAGDNSCNLGGVVVIVSHGKNGLGGVGEDGTAFAAPTSAREIQNAGNNTAFVRADYSTVDANYFDDIVLAITPDDLLQPLVKDGALSSARANTQKQLELSRDALIAASVTSGNTPGAMTAATDGWGSGLVYARSVVAICGAAANLTAFTVTSPGPDLVAGVHPISGVNDDIALTQSNDQLKSYIIKGGGACS